jgi:protoporphyrinogen oxidase
LGAVRVFKIGMSYIIIRLFPLKDERSLEDFFINRFGKELYETFFKDYTEKVWGVACSDIKAEWGAQRVKGLSISKAVLHAMRSLMPGAAVRQKKVETSLIDQFMYPKYGPGQLWQEVAKQVEQKGGKILMHHRVVSLQMQGTKITGVTVENTQTGETAFWEGEHVISTMPVKDLVAAMGKEVPSAVAEVAAGLQYRDFITVGVLAKKLRIKNETTISTMNNIVPDNWIYVQEREVRMGRIQIFNNWSPYLVANSEHVWLGLEYFCNEGDSMWNLSDEQMSALAAQELQSIGFVYADDIIDTVVIRVQKTYPAYFGAYDSFSVVREYADRFSNLFLVGRNGMHRYNNMDHSMLTAMTAVENIRNGVHDKTALWNINTEESYHETEKAN